MSENDDNYVKDLELFIANCEYDLNKLINQKIGWKINTTSSHNNKCPFNDHHSNISNDNYEQHVNKCYLISKNYTKDDVKEFFKQVTIHSPYEINIGEQQEHSKCFVRDNNNDYSSQNKILDRRELNHFSYKQLLSLNSEEKLKNYELALNHFRKCNIKGFSSSNEKTFLDLSEFDVKPTTSDEKKSSCDYADILAELQDRKRRTKSYKTSGSKKTYTDTMRQLIESQMEMLEELNKMNKEKKKETTTTKKKRSKSKSHDYDNNNDSDSSSQSHHNKKNKKHHKKHHKHKHKNKKHKKD